MTVRRTPAFFTDSRSPSDQEVVSTEPETASPRAFLLVGGTEPYHPQSNDLVLFVVSSPHGRVYNARRKYEHRGSNPESAAC